MIDTLYTIEDFPYDRLGAWEPEPRRRGNQSSRRRLEYFHNLSAFDIETTSDPQTQQAWMYDWQWGFEDIGVLIGRTWDELRAAVSRIRDVIDSRTLVVLVHNLSFEFQFLRTVHEWEPGEVFALRPRKVLRAYWGNSLEFRCTYLHSNMSLDLWTEKMMVPHRKLSGDDYDYNKFRYPDTPMTDAELAYCANDVLGCMEAYRAELRRDHDVLYSIPLTSTGYVRRDVKRAMHPYGRILHDMAPDYPTYVALREAFRGGLTHANRYYSGVLLHEVSSADRSSSYPDVICNCQFPMGKPRPVWRCNTRKVLKMMKDGKAILARCTFVNIRLKNQWDGFPYLSASKCRGLRSAKEDGTTCTYVEDNGRVLRADFLETTLTDIDLQIVLKQYDFDDLQIFSAWWTHYGDLPTPLMQTVIDYYRTKTSLKDVEDPTGTIQLLYDKSKNLLNSCYGMMAQDPLRDPIAWLHGMWRIAQLDPDSNEWTTTLPEPSERLQKAQRNLYVLYQWGVWVTAWARLRLMEGIWLCGDKCVYVDTDSCKYLGSVDWTEYNAERIRDSKATGAHATDQAGKEHYMGVYVEERGYTDFKTLGAKKYAYIKRGSDEVETTIAGVSKRLGGKELQAHGGLDAFTEGFRFSLAGGVGVFYNDDVKVEKTMIHGHSVEIGPNVCLLPSTYKVSLSEDYRRILEEISEFGGLTGPGNSLYTI